MENRADTFLSGIEGADTGLRPIAATYTLLVVKKSGYGQRPALARASRYQALNPTLTRMPEQEHSESTAPLFVSSTDRTFEECYLDTLACDILCLPKVCKVEPVLYLPMRKAPNGFHMQTTAQESDMHEVHIGNSRPGATV